MKAQDNRALDIASNNPAYESTWRALYQEFGWMPVVGYSYTVRYIKERNLVTHHSVVSFALKYLTESCSIWYLSFQLVFLLFKENCFTLFSAKRDRDKVLRFCIFRVVLC